VLLGVTVFLLTLELLLRSVGSRLSHDVKNISGIESVATALEQAPPPRVLFVGNSILLAGIDPIQFQRAISAQPGAAKISTFIVHPDSSHATVWDYLLHRYFIEPEKLPDDVFLVSGRVHLADREMSSVELGGYYVSNRDIVRYFNLDNGGFDEGVGFFLGRISAIARLRKRVSPRIFDVMLPFYQENWSLLHHGPEPAMSKTSASALPNRSDEELLEWPESSSTTRHLQSIADTLREKGIRLTIVLAPMPRPYKLDPGIEAMIEERDIRLLDMRQLPGLRAEDFADQEHLNETGREIFTNALAKEVANYWIPGPSVR
jgi:hypothetical protein